MYNLLEYSKNYSKVSGSLWNYYRDEVTNETNDNNGLNKNLINSKSFKYKTSITGSTYNVAATVRGYDANKKGTKEVDFNVLLDGKLRDNSPTGTTFKITSCKLYVQIL